VGAGGRTRAVGMGAGGDEEGGVRNKHPGSDALCRAGLPLMKEALKMLVSPGAS